MTRKEQTKIANWLVDNTIFKTVAIDVQQKKEANKIFPAYAKSPDYINTGISDTTKTVCYIRPINNASIEKVSCNALGTVTQKIRLVCYSNQSEKNPRFLMNQILSSPFGPCVESVIEDRDKLFDLEQKGTRKIPFRVNDVYFALDMEVRGQTPVCEESECIVKNNLVCA